MIEQLQVYQFRNLHHIHFDASVCNVIIGDNGSGKTSLLESIYLLSRGKSFRHHQPKRYIEHQQTQTTVFARLQNTDTVAIQKNIDASTVLKYNQTSLSVQSHLTKKLPMLLIDPSSMVILEQGSSERRQILDWIAFHVKHGFYEQWLCYQRLLKQRNMLLKKHTVLSALQREELQAWDWQLSYHTQLLHEYRQEVFLQWEAACHSLLAVLLPNDAKQIKLSYYAGYDMTHSLADILQQRLEQDLHLGYTRVGGHRADVMVQWQLDKTLQGDDKNIKEQAVNVLSRGEKKLLITALRLSQLKVLLDYHSHIHPIVLLDDITAELDKKAVEVLLLTLSEIGCQVFITSLTDDVIDMVKQYWQTPKVFHVKQGRIKEVS